jgi:hypothetical protein
MDAGNAGRGPSHALGFFALDPGPYRAFEGNLAAVGFDDDAVGIELGVTPDGISNSRVARVCADHERFGEQHNAIQTTNFPTARLEAGPK